MFHVWFSIVTFCITG